MILIVLMLPVICTLYTRKQDGTSTGTVIKLSLYSFTSQLSLTVVE